MWRVGHPPRVHRGCTLRHVRLVLLERVGFPIFFLRSCTRSERTLSPNGFIGSGNGHYEVGDVDIENTGRGRDGGPRPRRPC